MRGLGVDIDGDGLPFEVARRRIGAGGTVEIDASGSSQFVSGLLLSGAAFADGLTIVHTGDSVPVGSARRDDGRRCCATPASTSTTRRPTAGASRPGPIAARHWDIEPDLSNSVPFLAAAVVTGGTVRIAGWPAAASSRPTPSLDSGKLGSTVRHGDSYLEVQGASTYGGIDVDLHDVGELAPSVAALAALAADGAVSQLRGIAHLRGHETDRLAALCAEINGLGGQCEETPTDWSSRHARCTAACGTPMPTTGWPRRARSSACGSTA